MFTDDARVDYSAAGLIVGTCDEAVEYLSRRQASVTGGMHYVTNVESRIEGDRAEVQAMWFNAVRFPGATDMSSSAAGGETISSGHPRAGGSETCYWSGVERVVRQRPDARQAVNEVSPRRPIVHRQRRFRGPGCHEPCTRRRAPGLA